MNNAPPTLLEITQLTRQELTAAQKSDSIRECGRAALVLLARDPDTCLSLAYQKLHDVSYKEVKTCWRRLYTDSSLWKVIRLAEAQLGVKSGGTFEEGHNHEEQHGENDWVDEVVRLLDMALILTGAPEREELVELWFAALKGVLPSITSTQPEQDIDGEDRPLKRRRVSPACEASVFSTSYPTKPANPFPTIRRPITRSRNLSLSSFQTKLSNVSTHTPLIFEGALQHWPALHERAWNNPAYLLSQTLGGRRLIPVEIGKTYTDENWGQKIITFQEFMSTYMLTDSLPTSEEDEKKQTGYLAQHDLFAQIPSLRSDISIPDYCYADAAPSQLSHIKPVSKLDEPLLNAWFGPEGTVSPLHTDPYHNILAQVVGYKYVRLYAPGETARLYPRSVDESGVDMSNTSQVDLDEAMRAWSEISCWGDGKNIDEHEEEDKRLVEMFPEFRDAEYVEGILAPGECLYIPVGWWHYVRGLTTSFSVSFWFN